MSKIQLHSLVLILLLTAVNGLRAQGTAFTYQGTLNVSGAPANGSYDLSFTLYDAATNGDIVGSVTNAATSINGGSFMVTLDFGGVFTGTNYWLEIAARTNGIGAFTTLSPRQPVLPVPYSVYSSNAGNASTATVAGSANSVAGSNILGTVAFAQLPTSILTNNATNVILNGTFTGNAGGLTNLNASSLTGLIPAASLPDAEASAFCRTNNITDPVVQSDVTGFVRELKSSGSFSLLADGLLLDPRFNPTNQLSFFGNPETVTNLSFSSWGAQFNGSNSIHLPLTSPVTSNTLVFVFRSPYLPNDAEEFVLGLVNSNTLSADWLWEDGNAGTYELWQRSGVNFPFGGYSGFPAANYAYSGFPYDNLILPRWINSYTYLEGAARMNQRKVFAMTSDGRGNSQFWQDTVQALIGTYTQNPVYNSPVTNSDPMNVLCVGQDYTNLSNQHGPWQGEMSAVLVFKGVLTSNQMNSVYRALRWLEPDTVERLFVGDSLTAADIPGTNNYPQFFENGKPGENCWRNNAQGGTTALQFTNYPLTSISSLPYPSKVKEIDVYYAFGVNDLYGNGDSAANILGYSTNSINALQALGAKVYYVTICHIWQYAVGPYYFNAGIDSSGVAIDQYFYTNFGNGNTGLAGIIPKDQIVSQPLLDIFNNFSTDGLHFYGPLGYVANHAVADYMLGKPYIVGYSVPDPNHPVWPYDAYGNVWLDPTTTLPAAQISGPIPNASLSGTYSSTVKLTNPSNTISGNGAGLTQIPTAAIAGGLTTNIVMGGHIFCYSNGVLVNFQ